MLSFENTILKQKPSKLKCAAVPDETVKLLVYIISSDNFHLICVLHI